VVYILLNSELNNDAYCFISWHVLKYEHMQFSLAISVYRRVGISGLVLVRPVRRKKMDRVKVPLQLLWIAPCHSDCV